MRGRGVLQDAAWLVRPRVIVAAIVGIGLAMLLALADDWLFQGRDPHILHRVVLAKLIALATLVPIWLAASRELADREERSEALENALCRETEEARRLALLATQDELTGLSNRRAFLDLAAREMNRAVRYERPISLCYVDLDHFKSINDRHGHAAGDRVLAITGQVLRETIRDTDLAARFGGDEFCILLPETDAEQALVVVQRFRATLAARATDPPITLSAGVAGLTRGQGSLADLLDRADAAMYRAKLAGRNGLVVA